MGIAVCLAWAVGAYSRLNRMREQVLQARASVLKYCKLYPALLSQWQTDFGDMNAQPANTAAISGQGAGFLPWKNLSDAILALQTPLAAWEVPSATCAQANALSAALDEVQSCVEALASVPEDLAGAVWPVEERGRWMALVADIRLRRSRYNVYANEMNEAAAQMPAALIARVAGISIWGLL